MKTKQEVDTPLSLDEAKEFRRENRALAGEDIANNLKIINSSMNGLRNILFTMATFLFVFSSSDFFIENAKLPEFIILAWCLLLGSIISGIVQYYLDIKFHKDSLDKGVFRDNIWAPRIKSVKGFFSRIEKTSSLGLGETKNSSETPLLIQGVLVGLAFFLLIIVASSSLVNTSVTTSTNSRENCIR